MAADPDVVILVFVEPSPRQAAGNALATAVQASFLTFSDADVHDYQQIIDPALIAPEINMVGIKGDFQPFIVSFRHVIASL